MEYQFIHSKFLGLGNQGLNNLGHNYNLLLQLQFGQYVNTNLAFYRYTGNGFTPLDLVDIKMNWVSKSKYRIYITGNNLLNKRVFVHRILTANSVTSTEQSLVARRIVVGVDIPL